MAKTLQQILIDANATLDLEAALPTGDELTLRQNYANQSVLDAVVTGQLSELTQEYVRASAGITLPLPDNFYEFKIDPKVKIAGGWDTYPEIDPEDKYDMSDNEKYCYVLGNPSEGYSAIFNGLSSSATVSAMIQRYPSGMLTLTDKCELSDSTYVTRGIESYVLYSRGDDRFPTAKALKDRQLESMYSREMKTPGGQARSTQAKFRNPLR